MSFSKENSNPLWNQLVQIMSLLRSEKGCPWDKKQTHQSLAPYLIEESYELLDAIDHHNLKEMQEELGDVLLQVIFHSQLASEKNHFGIHEVLKTLIDKLITRHPHVFEEKKEITPEAVLHNWEKIKQKEKKGDPKGALGGMPKELPALLKGYRMGQKASSLGFDWEKSTDLFPKIEEELSELKEALRNDDRENIKEEFGDLLFTLCNLGRFLKVNPEEALRAACQKFETRFSFVEQILKREKKDFSQNSMEELENLWKKAKEKSPSHEK